GAIGLAHQRERELVGAHGKPFVLLRDGVQVVQPTREFAVLVAQHFQLVAGQRRRGAILARHHQAQRQVRELLQEPGLAAQPCRHFVRAEFFGIAHPVHSPSKTNAAGPAIATCAASSGQAMRSSPPGSSTATSRSTRPARTSTATAAQAPLPQASVSPTPRSYTRRRMRPRSSTWAKPTLADDGNSGEACSAGPIRATAAASTSSTSMTACGLPIDTAPKRNGPMSASAASYVVCCCAIPAM